MPLPSFRSIRVCCKAGVEKLRRDIPKPINLPRPPFSMRRIKKLGHEQNTAAQGKFLGMSHIHSGGFEKFKVLRFFQKLSFKT